MSKENKDKKELADTLQKVESVPQEEQAKPEVKISYTQTILAKRKAALAHAQKAFEQAIKKRELELGKLCLECGLGDYDSAFLKDQLLKLAKGLPKRSLQE